MSVVGAKPAAISAKDLYEGVRSAIHDAGAGQRKTALMFMQHLPLAFAYRSVRFFDHELRGTYTERKEVIRARVSQVLRDLSYDLTLRGADPSYGVEIQSVVDGRGKVDPRMGDYAAMLAWVGPKPVSWPHPVTPEDVGGGITDAQAEEAGREIQRQNPEQFADALRAIKADPHEVRREIAAQDRAMADVREELSQVEKV